MKKRMLFLCLILLVALTGCKKEENDIIDTKVIVKDMELDNIGVLLNFYQADTKDTFALVWDHNKPKKYDDTYMTAISDIVPSKAVKRFSKHVGYEETFLELDESVFFYDRQEDYEVFIVENRDKMQWKLYFLYGDEFKEVVIQNDEALDINDYQIDKDCIYLFSKYICRIDLNDYSTEKFLEEKDCFDLYGTGELDLIYEDKLICAINQPLDGDGYKGLYRIYDFETKEIIETEVYDYINKIFPYNNGYLALCTKQNTWEPCIKYFDDKFNLLEEKDIDIHSDDGNVVIGLMVYNGHLLDGKIYSIMMVDGSYTNEIVVLDAESAKVLYQAEIRFKNRQNYFLSSPRFYDISNGLMSLQEYE